MYSPCELLVMKRNGQLPKSENWRVMTQGKFEKKQFLLLFDDKSSLFIISFFFRINFKQNEQETVVALYLVKMLPNLVILS